MFIRQIDIYAAGQEVISVNPRYTVFIELYRIVKASDSMSRYVSIENQNVY